MDANHEIEAAARPIARGILTEIAGETGWSAGLAMACFGAPNLPPLLAAAVRRHVAEGIAAAGMVAA
ncbi:hypothetical protein [Magnetospirillum sp. ME-1]|uniref:hypothetical protein n=1 Tax=Magnetospirillum sp. ME-1 TaxID=1639348 RepID=UPI0011AE93B1|nr:hypothetical protein [Magnetospirillum sp. ME-1]